jgi:hypothetical protein
MEKIVVAKLVRLGKDGDNFSKDLIAKEERTNAKVHMDYLDEMNKNWKTSGRLYIIDEKATKERDEKVNPKPKLSERDKLKAKADEMGLTYAKNIKTEKLAELIKDSE